MLGIIIGTKNKVVHNMGKISTLYKSLPSEGKQIRYVKYLIH